MKTIIIIDDLPFSQYHTVLNDVLKYIDNSSKELPVTRFIKTEGVDGNSDWDEWEEARADNDYDFYIISTTLNPDETTGYSEHETEVLNSWLTDNDIYPVNAHLLNEAFNTLDGQLRGFIDGTI